jgi:hypothetical protein
MVILEQMGNLPDNFRIANAFRSGGNLVEGPYSPSQLRYLYADGSGFDLFGSFILNDDRDQVLGGEIVQINLLDRDGALAGHIYGVSLHHMWLPYSAFLSHLSNGQSFVKSLFSGRAYWKVLQAMMSSAAGRRGRRPIRSMAGPETTSFTVFRETTNSMEKLITMNFMAVRVTMSCMADPAPTF